jgi:3-oxoacyl-[acyl-carrier protein] reductase
LKSVYLSALHAVPVFKEPRRRLLVNIASTAGIRPRPGLTVLQQLEAAVILMSKSMAAEFGPDKIRVNCVNPCSAPTPSLSAELPAAR